MLLKFILICCTEIIFNFVFAELCAVPPQNNFRFEIARGVSKETGGAFVLVLSNDEGEVPLIGLTPTPLNKTTSNCSLPPCPTRPPRFPSLHKNLIFQKGRVKFYFCLLYHTFFHGSPNTNELDYPSKQKKIPKKSYFLRTL